MHDEVGEASQCKALLDFLMSEVWDIFFCFIPCLANDDEASNLNKKILQVLPMTLMLHNFFPHLTRYVVFSISSYSFTLFSSTLFSSST